MPARSWKGKKVLIVDDSALVRTELENVYTALGMRVVGTAINGVEALKQVEKFKPDLVSLDIIMPEMDGIECYRKLSQAYGDNLKCVVISWIAGEKKVIDGLAKIMPAHLFQAKPVTAAELESRLEKVFNPPSEQAMTAIPDFGTAPEKIDDFAELAVKIS